MGHSGAVCREHSSGARIRRGPISKTGNAHLMVGDALLMLAHIDLRANRTAEARTVMERAVRCYSNLLGTEAPLTAKAREELQAENWTHFAQ